MPVQRTLRLCAGSVRSQACEGWSKRQKLIQWWLGHRVPIDVLITPEIEAAACRRFYIPAAAREGRKKGCPLFLVKRNQKKAPRVEERPQTSKPPPHRPC